MSKKPLMLPYLDKIEDFLEKGKKELEYITIPYLTNYYVQYQFQEEDIDVKLLNEKSDILDNLILKKGDDFKILNFNNISIDTKQLFPNSKDLIESKKILEDIIDVDVFEKNDPLKIENFLNKKIEDNILAIENKNVKIDLLEVLQEDKKSSKFDFTKISLQDAFNKTLEAFNKIKPNKSLIDLMSTSKKYYEEKFSKYNSNESIEKIIEEDKKNGSFESEEVSFLSSIKKDIQETSKDIQEMKDRNKELEKQNRALKVYLEQLKVKQTSLKEELQNKQENYKIMNSIKNVKIYNDKIKDKINNVDVALEFKDYKVNLSDDEVNEILNSHKEKEQTEYFKEKEELIRTGKISFDSIENNPSVLAYLDELAENGILMENNQGFEFFGTTKEEIEQNKNILLLNLNENISALVSEKTSFDNKNNAQYEKENNYSYENNQKSGVHMNRA